MDKWNVHSKQLLKAELVKRGISNQELSIRLNQIGYRETKASVASKISRGTFSASFLLQCLTVIGCQLITVTPIPEVTVIAESQPINFGGQESRD